MPRWPEKDAAPKDTKAKGRAPRTETRVYQISEAELAEFVAGVSEPKFFIKEIWVQPSGAVEFVLTTEKPTERPMARRMPVGTVNEMREQVGLPPIEETEATGPALEDDTPRGAMGTADPTPAIAPRGAGPRERLKTRRELNLEARAAGRPETAPVITHREGDEDGADDVPSQLPRQ